VDIGYKSYYCDSKRDEWWTFAATPGPLTQIVTTSSTVLLTTGTTSKLGQTSADPATMASSGAPSVATGVRANAEEADNSPSKTGAIVGGAVGGLACIAIAAVALLALRRRRKEKALEEPTETSFKVLSSNIFRTPTEFQDPNYQNPATGQTISPSLPYPNSMEAPSNVAQPLIAPLPAPTPSPDLTPAYQAYHPQHASVVSFSSNSFNLSQPVLSPQPSFQRPSQYSSHASFMRTVSEVHGQSAGHSRGSSATPAGSEGGEVAGSRFVELDVPQLSSQSGPVPEWPEKQELP